MEQKNIAKKMATIMKETSSYVPKNGVNDSQHYKYMTSGDAMAAIRKSMAENGVAFMPTIKSVSNEAELVSRSGSKQRMVMVNVECSFVDHESGESFVSNWYGSGADSGEKAIYKAYTGAIKYALTKTFLLQSDAEDDPEFEPEEKQEPPKQQKQEPPKQQKQEHRQEPKEKAVATPVAKTFSIPEDVEKILKENGGIPSPQISWSLIDDYLSLVEKMNGENSITAAAEVCKRELGETERAYSFFRDLGVKAAKPSDVLVACLSVKLGIGAYDTIRGLASDNAIQAEQG